MTEETGAGTSEPAWRRALAEADWLTPKRTLQVAILFGAVNAIVAVALLRSYASAGPDDIANALPDFAAIWAAGVATLQGDPALAYDMAAHKAIQNEAIGMEYVPWLAWHYPPTFQLLAAPFGAPPLFVAFGLWSVLTLALFLWACWRILPRPLTLLAAWAVPTSLYVFVIGQTGFLTAALFALFLAELDRRPALAGSWLGLLTIKPQLGLAAPFALVAGRRWRTIAAAAAVAVGLVLAATLAFGASIWPAFLESLRESGRIFAGYHKIWELYASLYGGLRMHGVPFAPAVAVHALAAVWTLWLLMRAWARPEVAFELKAALLACALVIATPRMMYYDLHILFVGALFQTRLGLREGFARWEKSLLLLAGLAAFSFLFQNLSPLFILNALVAPVMLASLLAGRPALRRLGGLSR